MTNLLDSLQAAKTPEEVGTAIRAAKPEELDAGHGTVLRNRLLECADRIQRVGSLIHKFLDDTNLIHHTREQGNVNQRIGDLAHTFQTAMANALFNDDEELWKSEGSSEAIDLLSGKPSGFYRAMLAHPEDDVTRLVYTDWLEDHGQQSHADLLRTELALRANRDATKTPALMQRREELQRAQRLHVLTHSFPDPALWPEDWKKDKKPNAIGEEFPTHMIDAFTKFGIQKQVEILSSLLRLPEQWADQHRLLRGVRDQAGNVIPLSALITTRRVNDVDQEGYADHQGNWQPLPSYAESGNPQVFSLLRLLHRDTQEGQEHRTMLFQRALQGFTQLRITPRLPVPTHRDALKESLRANADRIPKAPDRPAEERSLNEEEPVWMWNQYDSASDGYNPDDALVDHPDQFGAQQGRQPPIDGYDITLVEDVRVLPEEGREPVTAGYRSLGCNLSSREYLDLIHGRTNERITKRKLDPTDYQKLVFWAPRHYCVADMASLDLSGLPLDQDKRYRVSLLLGAYFQSSRYVPFVSWDPGDRRVYLSGYDPDYRFPDDGARVAVRVA